MKVKQKYHSKSKYLNCHRWFAWHPVLCENEETWVWFEMVWRKRIREPNGDILVYSQESF